MDYIIGAAAPATTQWDVQNSVVRACGSFVGGQVKAAAAPSMPATWGNIAQMQSMASAAPQVSPSARGAAAMESA